jgi:glycosyltransferase involved in cell wall biosynthesis
MFWPYVEEFEADYVVFHAYDAFRVMDSEWSAERDDMMSKLTARADLLTATTDGVIATFPAKSRANARLLENGANVELFSAAIGQPCPSVLAAVPRPRIGYVGTINRRIDFKTINLVARRRPEWHWVLVGHLAENTIFPDEEARAGYLEAKTLPNIHMFAEVPPTAVPAFVANMDVNTICYRIHDHEWISAGYPVKLHEYLAIGKPIISAPIDVIREKFTSVLRLAGSADEWEAAIVEALDKGGVGTFAARQAVARENTWDQRAALLDTWLKEMIRR